MDRMWVHAAVDDARQHTLARLHGADYCKPVFVGKECSDIAEIWHVMILARLYRAADW